MLPFAPTPPPRQLSEDELQKARQDEENTMRELRIFLRDVNTKLFQDRRFKEFTKPVDLLEVNVTRVGVSEFDVFFRLKHLKSPQFRRMIFHNFIFTCKNQIAEHFVCKLTYKYEKKIKISLLQ